MATKNVAKKNGVAKPAAKLATPKATHKAPEGYEEQSSDVKGFWDYRDDDPLHFIPESARLSDSKIDKQKVSVLVTGRLVDSVELHSKDDDGGRVMGRPGDSVGVWYKPGMAALKNLCGSKVFMYADGEKDTGQPQPMVVFKILARDGGGAPLPVTGDHRDKSRGIKNPIDGTEREASSSRRAPMTSKRRATANEDMAGSEEEDIDF